MKKREMKMTSERKRITSYVSEKKHKELKAFCSFLGISMSKFIDMAIEEKADKERERNK